MFHFGLTSAKLPSCNTTESSRQSYRTLDKEYADTIKQANKLVRNDEVDISTDTVGAPPPRRRRRRRRERLMCAIM